MSRRWSWTGWGGVKGKIEVGVMIYVGWEVSGESEVKWGSGEARVEVEGRVRSEWGRGGKLG